LSSLAVASSRPSGLNATPRTQSVRPVRVRGTARNFLFGEVRLALSPPVEPGHREQRGDEHEDHRDQQGQLRRRKI
jgi:hypothetical protein